MSRLILTIAAVFAFVLSACGSNATTQAPTAAPAPTVAPTAAPSAEPTLAPTEAPAASIIAINEPWARAAILINLDAMMEDEHGESEAPMHGEATEEPMHGEATDESAHGDAMAEGGHGDAMAEGGHADSGHGSGSNSAAYMQITNSGTLDDRLIAVHGDFANSIELHNVIADGDLRKMVMVEAIEIPAGQTIELAPGGYHVMIMGIKHDFVAGESITFTLEFEQAGKIEVTAEIR